MTTFCPIGAECPRDCARAQKASLRRLRRWRRAVGSHCLARRNLQNERRRSASLLTRRALKDRRAPSHGSDRRAAAVRLCAGGREGCGLKTPLTLNFAGASLNYLLNFVGPSLNYMSPTYYSLFQAFALTTFLTLLLTTVYSISLLLLMFFNFLGKTSYMRWLVPENMLSIIRWVLPVESLPVRSIGIVAGVFVFVSVAALRTVT